jgi:hypothetical protein
MMRRLTPFTTVLLAAEEPEHSGHTRGVDELMFTEKTFEEFHRE